MLGLAALFLISLIISASAIWLYRVVAGWQGYKQITVGRKHRSVGKRLTRQFGHFQPFLDSRKSAKYRRLRGPHKEIKAPWGW